MSKINFCNTKEQLNHLGEVVTGKTNGSPSGADIETSTLPYTGQVRNTLPALEELYLGEINEFIQESDQVIVDKTAEFDSTIATFANSSRWDTSLGAWAAGKNVENSNQLLDYNGQLYAATSQNNFPLTIDGASPEADSGFWVLKFDDSELHHVAITNNVGYSEVGYLQLGPVSGVSYFYDVSIQKTFYSPVQITGNITTIPTELDDLISITVDNTDYILVKSGIKRGATALELGLYPNDHENATAESQVILNKWLPVLGKITLEAGKIYDVTDTTYISSNQILTTDGEKRATLNYTPATVSSSAIVESEDFQSTAARNIQLDLIVSGNLDAQEVGVPNIAGGDGCGFKLTVGSSNLNIRAVKTVGVGIWLSNGGNTGLYTHVNNIYAVAAYTGQEGIIFDGGNDQRCSYLESYFAWDSLRDTDYTQDKGSLAIPDASSMCAGILFYRGSWEIDSMHPNNNRHGYAFATYGAAGNAGRMRFAQAIGEGSAGGAYFSYVDDISGSLLNVHSTRGKYGLPLLHCRSGINFDVDNINIKVDVQSGYPDEGTYRAAVFDGENTNIANLNVYATNGQASNAVTIQGDNHKIKGKIHRFSKKVDGDPATGLTALYPLTNSVIDMQISDCGVGLSGASANTDCGLFNLTFSNCDTDVSEAYLGFMDRAFVKRGVWYNLDTGKTNQPTAFYTDTLESTEADGTTKTITVGHSDLIYGTPVATGLSFANVGSASYNMTQPAACWVAGTTETNVSIKYNVAAFSGSFRIQGLLSL